MHDPRIGRFFAVDPLTAKYPWYTPYSFSGNKVIAFVELEGLEEYMTNDGVSLGKVGDDNSIRIFKTIASGSKEANDIREKIHLINVLENETPNDLRHVSALNFKKQLKEDLMQNSNKALVAWIETNGVMINKGKEAADYLKNYKKFHSNSETARYPKGNNEFAVGISTIKVILDDDTELSLLSTEFAMAGFKFDKDGTNGVWPNGWYYTASQEVWHYDKNTGLYYNSHKKGMKYHQLSFGFQLRFARGTSIPKRTGHNIHPDTNIFGTQGCTGLHGSNEYLSKTANFYRIYMKGYMYMTEIINIRNNPNHGKR